MKYEMGDLCNCSNKQYTGQQQLQNIYNGAEKAL